MSDPKYANLPGIAFDQPDSYETEDLPESDQYIDFEEPDDDNVNIERPHISLESAFEKFRLTTVGGLNTVNFSENNGYRTGNRFDNDNYGIKETPAVRLARLKLEVEELKAELKDQPINDGGSGQAELKELLNLEKELESISHKKMEVNMAALKEKLVKVSLSEPAAGQNKTLVSLDGRNVNSSQKAVELEARLQKLENVLGNTTQPLASIGLQPKNSTVLGAINVLHSKLSLLEPTHVELLEAKLNSILQKVTRISEKKLDVQELERTLKLSSLYDLLESSSTTLEALPEITHRLDSLRDLHRKASEVVHELNEIKSIQNSIRAGASDNEKQLKELQTALESFFGKM